MGDEFVFKRCLTCGDMFSSTINNPNSYCAKHQYDWNRRAITIIRQRYVPSNYFDVWDYRGYPLCRQCGKVLQNRDGSKPKRARFCNRHTWSGFMKQWDWGLTREAYLQGKAFKDARGKWALKCEQCEQVMPFWEGVEVHHKRPVASLTPSEIKLVFDHANLIALCHDCHVERHAGKKLVTIHPWQRILDEWVKRDEVQRTLDKRVKRDATHIRQVGQER